jgi:hypothetical protein
LPIPGEWLAEMQHPLVRTAIAVRMTNITKCCFTPEIIIYPSFLFDKPGTPVPKALGIVQHYYYSQGKENDVKAQRLQWRHRSKYLLTLAKTVGTTGKSLHTLA